MQILRLTCLHDQTSYSWMSTLGHIKCIHLPHLFIPTVLCNDWVLSPFLSLEMRKPRFYIHLKLRFLTLPHYLNNIPYFKHRNKCYPLRATHLFQWDSKTSNILTVLFGDCLCSAFLWLSVVWKCGLLRVYLIFGKGI